MKIKGLAIKPEVYTSGGLPSTDMPVLKTLSGNN